VGAPCSRRRPPLRPIAAAMTDAAWKPPVHITGTETAFLFDRQTRFLTAGSRNLRDWKIGSNAIIHS
jgi:hypothetical protein